MKGIKGIIIAVAGAAICVLCLLWLLPKHNQQEKTYSIAVVHSWDDKGEDGELFRQLIKQDFTAKGYVTDIHHYYFNSLSHDSTEITDALWDREADSIKSIHPDIVLINDDPALDGFLDRYVSGSPFGNTPVVFAGINSLQTGKLTRHRTYMTGLRDTIDLPTNLNILHKMTGEKKTAGDAVASGQIHVKCDTISKVLPGHAETAQVTCIREMFNIPSHPSLLCGYFTSTKTQIEDQVEYAARILEGVKPYRLPMANHAKDYYLDYNAYTRYHGDVSIEECKEMFRVINMPFSVADPVLYYITCTLALIIIISIVVTAVIRVAQWFSSSNSETLEQLEKQSKLRHLIFNEADFSIWQSDHGKITFPKNFAERNNIKRVIPVQEFANFVSEDTKEGWLIVSNHPLHLGTHRLRLCLSFDGKKTWNWYEVLFKSTPETARSMRIEGVFQNINDVIAKEEEMRNATKQMNDIELEESFLANISHDLRTPLNAVTGFSNLLTMSNGEMSFSKEEQREFCNIIHQNSEMMINMVNSVIGNSPDDMADIKMKLLPYSINVLINDVYITNTILVPSHLTFGKELQEDDAMVLIDLQRTKQVINNFLSNAFKFTPSGSITIGWRRMVDENIGIGGGENEGKGTHERWIEIYVKDTGIGITDEEQAHLFDRFYTVKEHATGTGLGLDISKTIMEKQNGTIGVESTSGKGSRFFIRLKEQTPE